MDKMRMESMDMTAQNIEKIGELFPNCITEMLDEEKSTPDKKVYKKAVNFEMLKQMLSGNVLDGDEAYEFTWVGKKAAIVKANKPIKKTLRPCPEESVDWDSTENLYIEGDNLEVLKLLQESYLGKVKMIYIDPPYNTGNDFIYNDDFKMTREEYADEIGEIDENGNRMFKNTDSNGRFHSNWCSIMYSRLMLTRNLLKDDGVIFISIDDKEMANLIKICDEVFGQDNFQGMFVINASPSAIDYGCIAKMHEYAVMYSKNSLQVKCYQLTEEDKKFDYKDELGEFIIYPLYNGNVAFNPQTRPNLFYPFYLNPNHKLDNDFYEIGLEAKEGWVEVWPVVSKKDGIYNMVYRLDAMEAYNKRLVKKIAVKGISESGTSATESYVYLESINLSNAAPTATIQFDCKGKNGVRNVTRTVGERYNLYDNSGYMEEYKQGFVVSRIDGRDDSVEFLNGIKIFVGDVIGKVSEEQIRRIQIRETILSHIQRERELFYKGIKVLSLFFIDEVARYKQYDEAGQPVNGVYADIFEEEYNDIISNLQINLGEDDYLKYLKSIPAEKTHAGYFSIDKKGKMIDSKVARRETTTDDVDAYDLIMKNKELLLDRNPKKSPVRFIFSHSALREGWDNPNVFQICTLKQSSSEVRKRQEVGRGLRLCVNENGERMDVNMLGNDVHNVNVLTVIASESYDSFAKGLQSEIAEAVADRPRAVTAELFIGKVIKDSKGNEQVIDSDTAHAIYFDLILNRYIDKKGILTDKYYEDKANGEIQVTEEVADSVASVIEILDSIYDSRSMQPEDARKNNVELRLDEEKLNMPEFKKLWPKINSKTIYVVDFDTEKLVRNAIDSLDRKLRVSKIYFKVETGSLDQIKSKEDLISGAAFVKEESENYNNMVTASSNIKYDLIGKLVDETKLTRKDIIRILQGIQPSVFNQFKDNPEEFIIKAAALINNEKAAAIVEHITYKIMDDKYSLDMFTERTIKGRLGVNAMKTKKHLYDHIVYDSTNEQKFAMEMETNKDVALYIKLPDRFYISTPVGHYNPDWAVAFYEGTVKHIYFVAETKGSMDSMQLRLIEEAKIHCAREHFKAISNGEVEYDVVDSFKTLWDIASK